MPSHSSAHASRHHAHRSRSRSPHASSHHRHRRDRSRSRSPHRRHHHRSHHASRIEKPTRDGHGRHGSPSGVAPSKPVSLPFDARKLSKHDYAAYRPMFALYLDIQKQKILEDMDEAEIKGRWKSFVGKWNRGELAEGWYDPNTLQKAIDSSPVAEEAGDRGAATRSLDRARRASPDYGAGRAAAAAVGSPHDQDHDMDEEEEDSEGEFGPAALPGQVSTRASRVGPTVPRLDDLELQKESRGEEQEARIEALRAQRKADRAQQKERLEELVPRADPGSRERQLEKKMDKTAAVRSFREAKSPGAEEIRESDLMGDDVDTLKARKREEERRKSERELRREEIMRAKAAEREERIAEYRSQEDQTMEMLQALAKQRFGGGGY